MSSLLSLSSVDKEISDSTQNKAVTYTHCTDKRIRTNGKLKEVQRYLCNGCGKNFSETAAKFWQYTKKKDKVNRYLYCLLSGYSMRKSAKETGISIQTSFSWGHKLLISFSSVSIEEFQGIVASDNLFFTYSRKGNRHLERKPKKRKEKANKVGISDEKVAIVTTCDRSGNKNFKVATRGRIRKRDLEKVLNGKLEKAELLCGDGHKSYSAFAKRSKITHKKFNASKGQKIVDKVSQVQNVHNMDMRLRKFMNLLNGVAPKYLQNYLNWFLVLEKIKNLTNRMVTITAIAFTSNSAWMEF